MQLLHSRNSWTFSGGYSRELDFCIWVLEVDGLHVVPFDQHDGGDGSLRATGMDAKSWQNWLIQVVALQYQQWQRQQKMRPSDPLDREAQQRYMRESFIQEAHHPPTAWNGAETVRARLNELWDQFTRGGVENERQKMEHRLSLKRHKQEVKQRINLWQDLSPYHTRLPTLMVHMVCYPRPLNYLVMPVSVLITYSDNVPGLEGYRAHLLDAAAGLAENGSRRRRSGAESTPYTVLDPPALLYKIFPPSPMLASPVRSNERRVSGDPRKQAVFDELYKHDDTYGDVNMESIRFVREKAIPGWQLYYVSFQELEGDKQTYVFRLKQQPDGSWRSTGASTSIDPDQLSAHLEQLGVVVHDHPMIFLNGGWAGSANDKVEFKAYGQVIDNGFNVTRVRLISETGQIFEDAVENGLVLFAATLEQQAQMPMQAELYDNAGQLVWRERVFEQGPPAWLKSRRPFRNL